MVDRRSCDKIMCDGRGVLFGGLKICRIFALALEEDASFSEDELANYPGDVCEKYFSKVL